MSGTDFHARDEILHSVLVLERSRRGSAAAPDRGTSAAVVGRGKVLRVSNYRRRVFASAVGECRKSDGTFPTITPTTCATRQPARQ